jgi:uncharacterized membrane protein
MATTSVQQAHPRAQRISRFLLARWRLLFSTVVCVLNRDLPTDGYQLPTRLLIGWDAGVTLYLILVLRMILDSDPNRLRNESSLQDDGRIAIPILTVIAAMASMGAIIFWMRAASQSQTISRALLRSCFSPRCCRGYSSI